MANVVGGEVREERARETDRVVLVGPCKDLDSEGSGEPQQCLTREGT